MNEDLEILWGNSLRTAIVPSDFKKILMSIFMFTKINQYREYVKKDITVSFYILA